MVPFLSKYLNHAYKYLKLIYFSLTMAAVQLNSSDPISGQKWQVTPAARTSYCSLPSLSCRLTKKLNQQMLHMFVSPRFCQTYSHMPPLRSSLAEQSFWSSRNKHSYGWGRVCRGVMCGLYVHHVWGRLDPLTGKDVGMRCCKFTIVGRVCA